MLDWLHMEELKDIVIIYHKHCQDGFAAAWAAWKKFGDKASYIPAIDRNVYPTGIYGKEVYIVDFSFSEPITRDLLAKNRRVVALDHHVSSKELVESLPEHVYSDHDSGAKIAWKYFHPTKHTPQLIEYVSDGDTWAHALPDWREIEAYLHIHELEFSTFDQLAEEIEDNREKIIEKGLVLVKQFDNLLREHVEKAMLVNFDGHEVYAVNASSFLRSELGHILALKKGPFSIVYRFEKDTLKVSLRGDGSIDCSKLAEKYGGGGHHNASAIILENLNPLPFEIVL